MSCRSAADEIKDTYLFIFPNWAGLSLARRRSNKFTTYHQPHSGAKAKVAHSKRRWHAALRGGSAGRNVAESTFTRAQPHNGSLPENLPVSVSVPGQGKSQFPDPVDNLASPIGFFTIVLLNGLIQ